jgi:hypothetical protein
VKQIPAPTISVTEVFFFPTDKYLAGEIDCAKPWTQYNFDDRFSSMDRYRILVGEPFPRGLCHDEMARRLSMWSTDDCIKALNEMERVTKMCYIRMRIQKRLEMERANGQADSTLV